jgi:hypothetical protein
MDANCFAGLCKIEIRFRVPDSWPFHPHNIAVVAREAFCRPLARLASAGETGLVLAQFSDCQWAVDRYNSALSDISYAVSRYASCIGSSRGFDDCSMEFLRLKNAQSDFEQAIMTYRFDCD